MKSFSYTFAQKKQKKIKISCTNRDPYLNYSTLIRSDYDNLSGIKFIEYVKDIHITNITKEFVKYFNNFITTTGTHDLSNFFDIEIKNISTNLEKILNNANNDTINYSLVKKNNYNQDCGMKITEIYNSNYKFIILTEQSHLETFVSSIEKLETKNGKEFIKMYDKYKVSLKSFILNDPKINLLEKLPFTININNQITNLTNLLPNQKPTDKKYTDNEIFKYIKLLQTQPLFDINNNAIYKNIINHQDNNVIQKKIFSFQIDNDLSINNFSLLNNNNESISLHETHKFNLNNKIKNNILEKYTNEKVNVYDESILEMNMIQINHLNFLNIKNSVENSNKNKNNDRNEIVIFNNLLSTHDSYDKLFSSIKENVSITNSNSLTYNNFNIEDVLINFVNNNLNVDNVLKLKKNNSNKYLNEPINKNKKKIFDEIIYFDFGKKYNNNLKDLLGSFVDESIEKINLNELIVKNNNSLKKINSENNMNEMPFLNMKNKSKINSEVNIFKEPNLIKQENKYNYNNNEIMKSTFKINNKLSIVSINSEKINVNIKEPNLNEIFSSINNIKIPNINKFIPEKTHEFENKTNTNNFELNIEKDKNITNFNNFLKNNITNINNNVSLEDVKKKYILNNLRNCCKCIVNVYQLVYNKNKIATGLGDFIRGSYFVIEFCKKYNFKYFIDLSNHPIKFFLKNYCKINLCERNKNIYKKINKFEDNNFNPVIDKYNFIHNLSDEEINSKFIEYLINEPIYNSNVYIYNTTFPKEGLSNNYKIIMRQIFEPTTRMELLINVKLKMLNLKPYSYEVIHIRCGDEYISNENINYNSINLKFIMNDFEKLNSNKKYLLISDNNFIKTMMKEKFNFINILYHDIIHTGENNEILVKKLENTILDFYLISRSKNVISYSVYKHGSGFSKWCAFTYDIPYYCKYFGKS